MSDTSVPPVQFTPTGLVLPQESAVLAGVQADMNAAFGGNLNFGTTDQPGGAPPQVQQAASTTAIIADNNSTFAEFVAQVDPDNAEGFMQDAIGRIYFMNRKPGTPTSVQLVCTGALGTPIPVGAQARDTSGNIYVCTQAGVIPAGGNITLAFANMVLGPIPCPANTVTGIYQSIPGWDTVNNPSPGTPGSNVESAADFEFRRQNSVASNSHGSTPAIYGAVFGVAGVIDAFATENDTDNPINGPLGANQSVPNSTNYTVVAHSFYVAVIGGAAADIANAIWTKKNEGSNMNGNTTVVVKDTSGYSFPEPSYNITFNRPTATSYNFIINIKNSASLPSTIVADVQAAVTAQFNGTNGGQRARIGSLLLAASYYGPVATCEGPSNPVQVLQILIGSTFSGTGSVATGSETLTISAVGSGSLSPGTALTGTGVAAGATIVQQLTGTPGGVGTYQMSAQATSTAGPEAITGAGSTAQQIGIDQAPVIGTITVNLV
jgi:uncharacterized phage protein gp47/JayE